MPRELQCLAMSSVKIWITFSALLVPLVSPNYTGDWSPWSTCSQSCGSGLQIRNRTCAVQCNDTLLQQTRECSASSRCHDLTLHLVIVIVVTAVVMAVMLTTIYLIFLREAPQTAKLRRESNCNTLEYSTCNRLRTNTIGGVSMGSIHLQNIRRHNGASPYASGQKLS